MISFVLRYNKRTTPEPKEEYRKIPNSYPFYLKLEEKPLEGGNFSVIDINTGFQFIETNNNPGSGEFKVDYEIGYIYFNESDKNKNVLINYLGLGSIVVADDVNSLQAAIIQVLNSVVKKDLNYTPDAVIIFDIEGNAKNSGYKFNDQEITNKTIWSAQKIVSEITKVKEKTEIPPETPNGAIRNFSLSKTPLENSEFVYVNGLLQIRGYSYDVVGNVIRFREDSIPLTGDIIQISYKYIE